MPTEVNTQRPEIVIGLVGAIGTDLDFVCDSIDIVLKELAYSTLHIRLSQLLKDAPLPDPPQFDQTQHERIANAYMEAGNSWRKYIKRGDAMVLLAVAKLREIREGINRPDEGISPPAYSHAFVLRSLKHPDEVKTLRHIYGASFFLLSAYAPRRVRKDTLNRLIMQSHNSSLMENYESEATELICRDEAETGEDLGQQVRKTFWQGDAFVDASDLQHLTEAIQRIFRIWFGHPFHTPTRDEYLMFSAQAAAYRSASLGRQVGAVIATQDGSLVATGTNEVPKAGGGHYWDGDSPDDRDHIRGYDSSDTMRQGLFGDILERLAKTPLFAENMRDLPSNELLAVLSEKDKKAMREAEYMNLTEFQRPVHAEMMAITDAARRGISIGGYTLYSTTFPCHGCARHIVASGIARVVFIEPYAKSLARNLHDDAIQIEGEIRTNEKVRFETFLGLAPRRYSESFAMSRRKEADSTGKAIKWIPHESMPHIGEWDYFLSKRNEAKYMGQLAQILHDSQLIEPTAI
ncbi:MAG: cytidine deaminase [Chthonomonadaceae bacterium]|nr:cytidine deaminase [Chthonomonadaceae bacterium]